MGPQKIKPKTKFFEIPSPPGTFFVACSEPKFWIRFLLRPTLKKRWLASNKEKLCEPYLFSKAPNHFFQGVTMMNNTTLPFFNFTFKSALKGL